MKFHSIILLLLLLLFGCVKNTISIHVDPNGEFNLIVHTHGDETDILDNDFPITNILNDNAWSISSTLDSNNIDTHDLIASKHFKSNGNIPQNFHINNNTLMHPLLKHDINVSYRNWFLYKIYSINIKFHSRMVQDKYPKFINIITDPESGYDGWVKEVFFYLFQETLNRTRIEFNQKAIIERELNTWLQKEIAVKSDSTIFEIFEDLKEEGLDLIMHPINPKFYKEIDSIFNYLETEYKTTQQLIDDEFEIKLSLPGILQESNYQNKNLDTLKWNFELKDFMNSDYEIYASSKITYRGRAIFTTILSLLILIILFIKKQL